MTPKQHGEKGEALGVNRRKGGKGEAFDVGVVQFGFQGEAGQ